MKKSTFFVFLIMLGLASQAQIVLDQSTYEPVLQDSYTVMQYDTVAAVPRNRGANQTWNFQNVVNPTPSNNIVYRFSDPLSFSGIPFCSMVENSSQVDKTFYQQGGTTSPLQIMGIETSIGIVDINSLPFNYRYWPVSYTDHYGNSCLGTFHSSNPSVTDPLPLSGNFISHAAGYGTVIGPDGTQYPNALQVLDTFIYNGSGMISGSILVTGNIIRVIHSYYVAGQRWPVVRFVEYGSSEEATVGTTPLFSSQNSGYYLEYTPSTATSLENGIASEISIYPNPTSSQLKVALPHASTLQLRNTLGQTVWDSGEALDRAEISVADLNSGIYFLQSDFGTKKIVVRH